MNRVLKGSAIVFLSLLMIISSLPLTNYQVQAEKVNVSDDLMKAFEKNDQVTYIVRMKEEVNLNTARKEGELAARFSSESLAKKEDVIRGHVVNTLQTVSDETQDSLTRYLDKQKKEKNVENYHSFYVINAIEVTSNKKVMEAISKRKDISSISLNETYTLDSKVIEQPKVDRQSARSTEAPWNLKNLNVPEVWKLGLEGEGVTVGVIDSGVDYEHEALKEQWRGEQVDDEISDAKYHWLDTTYENSKLPTDKNGHGTHVAGTVVGQAPDKTNKIGVAPKANWIAAKVFDQKGETSDSQLLRAGEWMLAPGGRVDLAPDIINNSWSISGAGKNEYFREVVQAWRAVNILPVFAAGNTRLGVNDGGPGSVPAPANYPESFTVGALDESNKLTNFSLLGPSPYDEIKPDIAAPGEAIRSAAPGGGYAYMDGTSMASPHVAGLAALVLEANPSLSVKELEEVLVETANPLTDKQYPKSPNNGYGAGIANALNAVSTYTKGLGELTGEVTREGTDELAPEIMHTPVSLAFNVLNKEIYAEVKDNIGIKSVYLEVRSKESDEWSIQEMELITGDTIEGEYEGIIPVEELVLPKIEYRIRATDYSGNEVVTEIYQMEVSEGLTKGYKQDFETDINGIEFQGDDLWEWGKPTTGPEQAYSGEKVMATNLDGNYENGSESMLILPLMDLRDEKEATVLSYAHWYKLGNWMLAEHDTAEVYVGTKSETEDAFDFELKKLYTYSQRDWKKDYVDLTPYLGEQIIVIFNLRGKHGSDLGWYLDDIELTEPETFTPDAPNISVRSNTPGRVIVEWPFIENDAVKDYVIYRSDQEDTGFEEIASTNKRVYGDVPKEQKGSYYYYVRSRTYGNELSEPSNIVSWTFTGGEEIYSTDFESGLEGWTADEDSDWELGMPRSNPGKVVSGSHAWGTNLNGYYKSNQEHILTSPLIDLSNSEHATIYFQQWYSLDHIAGEFGHLEISADSGETWDLLTSYPKQSYDNNHPTRYWYLDEVNIDAYVGQKVNIRFRLESKRDNVFDDGWFIDDFEVRDTPAVKTQMAIQSDEVESEEEQVIKKDKDVSKVDSPAWSDVIELRKLEKTKEKAKVTKRLNTSKLPLAADLSVKETNRTTKSDAGTGKYTLKHPEGSYSTQVTAYGYKTVEAKTDIKKGKKTEQNFTLEPLPQGEISGVLTDARTKEPIPNATVKVIEDMRVAPVKTDEQGRYTLKVYQGNYHLVTSAVGYMSTKEKIEVKSALVEHDLQMTQYQQGDDQILIYDDGLAENAVASKASDVGYAVRMTSNSQAQLLEAQFYFWDGGFPSPGGTDFQYAIYDADGEEGKPKTLLAGPYDAKAKLDGSWTEVMMDDPVIVEGDFYLVYLQKGDFPKVPALGIDTGRKINERSWNKSGQRWSLEKTRNYMIRSIVRPILGEKELKLTDIEVKPEKLKMKEEEKAQLHVTGIMKDGEDKLIIPLDEDRLIYKSLNEEIVKVTNQGEVEAVKQGKTQIEVAYEDMTKQVQVEVQARSERPTDPEPGNPDPEKPTDPEPGSPDPEKPTDPEPGSPDPEKPTDPEPGSPDPEKPTDPEPGNSGPEIPRDPKEQLVYPPKKQEKDSNKLAESKNKQQDKKKGKKKLPATATQLYNSILLGMLLLGVGVLLRRRKQKLD